MTVRYLFVVALLGSLASCRCDGAAAASDAGIDATVDGGDAGTEPGGPDAYQPHDVSPRAQCGDDATEVFDVGNWQISLSHLDGRWTATPTGADEPALLGPASCERPAARLFRGIPEVRSRFGNFQIDIHDAVTWSEAERELPRSHLDGDALTLTWTTADAAELALRFAPRGDDLAVELLDGDDRDGSELALGCGDDESFFGLGTQVTGMDLRGRTYPLWTQEQGNSKPEDGGFYPLNNIPEAAYAPMGVWHSTAGYSAVVTRDTFAEVDLCETDEEVVALRTVGPAPGVVVTSGTPRERMRAVTEYVGRVRADIPDWMFGFWVDAVTGPERLSAVAETLRANDIPASAIWSEDWIGGSTTAFGFRLSYEWSWSAEQYPDLPAIVDGLHADGFAFLGYFNPFVPNTTGTWSEAVANEYLVTNAAGEPYTFQDPAFRTAGLVDLTNPAARDWLAGYQRAAVLEVGLDGWMADFAEWLPHDAVLASGADPWSFHNRYPVAWQEANAANLESAMTELDRSGDWAYFARSGWASVDGGTPGVAPALWAGDQNTDWGYDDGFPTIVPIGAHAGLSGVAIYGSDIAGYNSLGVGQNTGKELWFRWASAGAFHPLMRTHHGGDECANWNFDRDAETLEHTRRWASVHALLLPEFRRLHAEAVRSGLPITRHPWLVEPDRPALWEGDQYQWFLGDDVLVAPVLTHGATDRVVTLPADGWWPLFGDAPVTATTPTAGGGAVVTTVAAPPTQIPVFVRPGRALVLLAEAVDSFYGASNEDVTDLDMIADAYRVALYPDAAHEAISPTDTPFAVGARGLDAFDPGAATLDGVALPQCGAPITESCHLGEILHLVDVTTASISAGGATIDVDSPGPVTLTVGIGGIVWGNLRQTRPFTPNPDAPSWCPPEEEAVEKERIAISRAKHGGEQGGNPLAGLGGAQR